MREIKFRGKSLNGEWKFGLIKTINRNSGIAVLTEDKTNVIREVWKCYLDTIGQYTGLKDKNGKEIYEGDVVKGVGHKIDSCISSLIPVDVIGVVGYCKEYQTLEVRTEQVSFHIEVAIKGEIIGNIHDNPGLIKQ